MEREIKPLICGCSIRVFGAAYSPVCKTHIEEVERETRIRDEITAVLTRALAQGYPDSDGFFALLAKDLTLRTYFTFLSLPPMCSGEAATIYNAVRSTLANNGWTAAAAVLTAEITAENCWADCGDGIQQCALCGYTIHTDYCPLSQRSK